MKTTRTQIPESDDLYRERTSLLTIIAALFLFIIGLVLLMAVNEWEWLRENHHFVEVFLRELSALLIVTVAVTLVWELAAKRAFVDEFMSKARRALSGVIEETRVAEELRAAGLKVFTKDFWHGIEWVTLFKDSNSLDLFFAHARGWVGAHTPQLQELANRQGARVRVVLPNPENPEIVAEMARRFGKSAREVRMDILETVKDLMNIFVEPFERNPALLAPNFSLYFCSTAPIFTFYRFDKIAVIALYKHKSGRGGIPVFVAEKGGALYDFVVQEMHGFIDADGTATQIYPE